MAPAGRGKRWWETNHSLPSENMNSGKLAYANSDLNSLISRNIWVLPLVNFLPRATPSFLHPHLLEKRHSSRFSAENTSLICHLEGNTHISGPKNTSWHKTSGVTQFWAVRCRHICEWLRCVCVTVRDSWKYFEGCATAYLDMLVQQFVF